MSFFSESSTGGRRRRLKNSRRNGKSCRKLSDSKAILRRLQALKDLIPSIRNRAAGDEVAPPQPVNADRIFDDAAGYILRLKTQVEILRHLVDFYSPSEGKLLVLPPEVELRPPTAKISLKDEKYRAIPNNNEEYHHVKTNTELYRAIQKNT